MRHARAAAALPRARVAEQRLRSGSEEVYELRGARADGSVFPLQIVSRNVTYGGEPARVSGLHDLTTLHRESQEQARRRAVSTS